MKNAYLFKVGHVTYGIVARNQHVAFDYAREVMRWKDRRFLGKDTRTPKQQYESFTIGINVPDDWVSPSTHLHRAIVADVASGDLDPDVVDGL